MKCGKPATVEIVWATERVQMCAEHAAQAGALAVHMGWGYHPREIIPVKKCESEVGE